METIELGHTLRVKPCAANLRCNTTPTGVASIQRIWVEPGDFVRLEVEGAELRGRLLNTGSWGAHSFFTQAPFAFTNPLFFAEGEDELEMLDTSVLTATLAAAAQRVEANYTAESWTAFAAALAAAQNALTATTQAEIDNAVSTLTSAMNALVRVQNDPDPGPDPGLTPDEPGDDDTPPIDLPFVDVDGHWAEAAIAFVFERELMQGVSATKFAPDATLSRAMVATILWRMEGSPAVPFANVFDDVPATAPDWYRTAVIWANANEIVLGYAGRFDPYADITREQLAAMLHRYTVFVGGSVDIPAMFNLNGFRDRSDVSEWAVMYKYWANYNNLILGRTPTTLVPQGNATRAECAMILYRFLNAF